MERRTLTWEERLKFFREISATGDSVSVLYWHKLTEKPKDGARILLKCLEKDGSIECYSTVYKNDKFYFMYKNGYGDEIPERKILGWDYYPYSDDDEL